MFTEFKDAKEYFYGKKNHFLDMGIENLKKFMLKFESPEDKLSIVQVAGTNGKGSVSSMLADILIDAGFKVGRYNSPVVFEERENITINNIPMAEEEFLNLVNMMEKNMEEAENEGRLPTIFELETAMAYIYFFEKKCDIVIMECGLGGKTDATNICKENKLAVITSVSMDHMSYLGDNICDIAKVKSGIIKKQSDLVMGPCEERVAKVIEKESMEKNVKALFLSKENVRREESTLQGQRFSYVTFDGNEYRSIKIKMLGENQTENAALAIEAAEVLAKKGYDIKKENIISSLEKTKLPGRFDMIGENPVFIIDGAHNEDASKRLSENIKKYLDGYNIVLIMGVFADKEYGKIIENMKDYMKYVVVTDAFGKRALKAEHLKKEIEERVKDAKVVCQKDYDKVKKEAVTYAIELSKSTGRESAVVAFGSLSYLKYLRGK